MVDWRVKNQNLLKNIKRESTTEVTKRTNFQESLEKLFDIASQEAEKVLRKNQVLGMRKAQEDLMFLESQRTDRIAKMANHDAIFDKQMVKSKDKKRKNLTFATSSKEGLKNQFATVKDTNNNTSDDKENEDGDFIIENNHKKKRSDTVTLEVPHKLS